jgi:hypothetical protein
MTAARVGGVTRIPEGSRPGQMSVVAPRYPCWSVHSPRFTRHKNESIDVAVVYGAAHMPAVTRQMSARFGYRPWTAEWLPVFDC